MIKENEITKMILAPEKKDVFKRLNSFNFRRSPYESSYKRIMHQIAITISSAISKTYLVALMGMLILSCGSDPQEKAMEVNAPSNEASDIVVLTKAQLSNSTIKTEELGVSSVASNTSLNGVLDIAPNQTYEVSVPWGGIVKHLYLSAGDYVKKGQPIAILENKEYIALQESYLKTLNAYKLHQKDYERQKELNVLKASSDKVLQESETSMKEMEIELNALKQRLKLISINPDHLSASSIQSTITIYAPVSAYVSVVNYNNGKYVMEGDVLATLLNPKDVFMNLYVPEKYISSLKIGQRVEANLISSPSSKIQATITSIKKDMDENKMTSVKCELINTNQLLLPGMSVVAKVEHTLQEGYNIHKSAVVTFNNQSYIIKRLNDTTFQFVEVNIVSSTDEMYLVESAAIAIPFNLVTQGAYGLLMKLKNKEE